MDDIMEMLPTLWKTGLDSVLEIKVYKQITFCWGSITYNAMYSNSPIREVGRLVVERTPTKSLYILFFQTATYNVTNVEESVLYTKSTTRYVVRP